MISSKYKVLSSGKHAFELDDAHLKFSIVSPVFKFPVKVVVLFGSALILITSSGVWGDVIAEIVSMAASVRIELGFFIDR